MNAISAENLSKQFGAVQAVKNLSFQIPKGAVAAFLGPNGAGKSTTVKMILGLKKPSSGRALVFQNDPHLKTVRDSMGYTGQDLNYPPHLRVKEILKWTLAQYSRPQNFSTLVDRCGLKPLEKRLLGGLSGGEKRRVGLALALAGSPQLLILDEPSTGLDIDGKQWLRELIKEYQHQGGTVLICTHDLHEASEVANQILLIDQGELLFSGALHEIMNAVDVVKVTYETKGQRLVHLEKDSDGFIRQLISSNQPVKNLRVHAATLEEALRRFRSELSQ